MRRRTSLAALALTGLMLTAGCGLTDNGPQPGVAAEVDGHTLQLDTVDQTVEDYCTLLAAHPEEQAFPTALIRTQLALLWARAEAIDAVAEDYGVPLPLPLDEGAVRSAWEGFGEIDDDNIDSFTWLSEIDARDDTVIEAIGTAALLADEGRAVSGQEAWDRGNELVAAWLAEADPELNPVFGEVDWTTGAVSPDALSVPVSDEATSLLDVSALSPEQVADLPEGQRCGPEPQAAAAPVPVG